MIISRIANSRYSYSKENLWIRSSFGLSYAYSSVKISNEEMGDIMKIVKSPEVSGLLMKETSETFKNEAK